MSGNFDGLTGRLVTDRFDFQDHIDGYTFRHNASGVDLSPSVTINGTEYTTTSSAIVALNVLASEPLPEATDSIKGILKIVGDISGTSDSITISGMQNRPISSLPPATNDYLKWDGTSWKPASFPTFFAAGGDLLGTATSQNVISLSGSAGVVSVNAVLRYPYSMGSPVLYQEDNPTNHGQTLLIQAQTALAASKNGGTAWIGTGDAGSGGLRGSFIVSVGSGVAGSWFPLQMKELDTNRRVLSLMHGTTLSSTHMPVGTGDMVVYVRDAITEPTSGNPVQGSILYSYGGKIKVKQSDGTLVTIGETINPEIYSNLIDEKFQSYSKFITGESTVSTPTGIMFQFDLPEDATTYITGEFVGKENGTAKGAAYTIKTAYTRNGAGAPVIVGTTDLIDTRESVGPTWTEPNITVVTNTLTIYTGIAASSNSLWFGRVHLLIQKAI